MTPWQESFEKQQFITKLDGMLDTLKRVSTEGLGSADLEQFARLVKATKFARARLKSVDPELVSQTTLNNVGGWLTNVGNAIDQFVATKNAAYIQSANTSLDSILDVVRSFQTSAREHEQVVASATTASGQTD